MSQTSGLAVVQVKLVKCVVADLVVDVSFETLGGLCTVAFLEAIDRKIGRSHLFKRSIVLVSSLFLKVAAKRAGVAVDLCSLPVMSLP